MVADMAPRVLFAVTSHTGPLGKRPTGAWLSEITQPWHVLRLAGFEIDYASPAGGETPIDPTSAILPSLTKREFATHGELDRLVHAMPSAALDPSRYDAIFYAGGHGTLWDFPDDPGLKRAAEAIWRRGGVVAATCHGPAGLLELQDERGSRLISGRRATGYSNLEERIGLTASKSPFLLEDAMKERGTRYSRSPIPFAPYVVVDGRLITGQNPLSARGVARALVGLVQGTRAMRATGDGHARADAR